MANILLVEGNLEFQSCISYVLEGLWHSVKVAKTVEEAKAKFKTQVFDLLLCSTMLKRNEWSSTVNLDWPSVAEEFKRCYWGKIIWMSKTSSYEKYWTGKCDSFVFKWVSPENETEAIKTFLTSKEITPPNKIMIYTLRLLNLQIFEKVQELLQRN